MPDTVIAVPSYRRAETICQKTLHLLLSTFKVSPSVVHVFVADSSERKKYQETLPKSVNIIVGKHGIGYQRCFINDYFTEGTRIVSMDDDLMALLTKSGNKTIPFTGDFIGLVEAMFDLCDLHGVRYWGVPETNNGMFMNNQAVIGLRACAGAFSGEYAKLPEVQSNLEHCEDYEKFLLHYLKFGGILRVNDLAPKQKFQAAGGVVERLGGASERVLVYHSIVKDLLKKYPNLVKPKDTNADYGQIRIKNITLARLESPVTRFTGPTTPLH